MKTSVKKARVARSVDDWMEWLNAHHKLNLPTLSSADHAWPDFLSGLWQMQTGREPDRAGKLPRGKIAIKGPAAFHIRGAGKVSLSALKFEVSPARKSTSGRNRRGLKAATGATVSFSGKLAYDSRAGKISVTLPEAVAEGAGNWRLQLAPKTLGEFWSDLTTVFGSIGVNVPQLPTDAIWSFLGPASITPTLSFPLPTPPKPVPAYFELKFNQPPSIPPQNTPWTFEPSIELDAVMISYDPDLGFDFKTRIKVNTASLRNGTPPKTETVGFPPSLPVPPNPILSVNYLGLGQHIGPKVTPPDPSLADPLDAIFKNIESQFQGADPQSIVTTLATQFYDPNRDWLVAADFTLLSTFNFRVLFNDPDFYGLEITISGGPLNGFLFEILYQKIGPNLGLYFGALNLPDAFRRIEFDGFVLILPGFSIWIYTNGDFKVAVGWPVGRNSLGVQFGPLVGWAGFYFAKLRGADLPQGALSSYGLILEQGFGIDVSFDASLDIGILSGGWHIDVGGTFQGAIAWHDGTKTLQQTIPDLYWFAGTANLSIQIWGEVNFGVVQASVGANLGASVSIAFQSHCETVIAVSASVSAYAKIKVGFFSVSYNFHTQLSHSFTIGSGPAASPAGPVPQLINAEALALPKPQRALAAPARRRSKRRAVSATPIDIYFVLQPTVVYTAPSTSQANVIASLVVPCPETSADKGTGFQAIVDGLIDWMVASFGGGSGVPIQQLQNIKTVLGPADGEPQGGTAAFVSQLRSYLQTSVPLRILPASSSTNTLSVAMLPMLDPLVLSAGGQTLDFGSYDQLPDDYATTVNAYFKDLRNTVSSDPISLRAQTTSRSRIANWTMATYVFGDYFLMICRHVVGELIIAANQHPELALLDLIAQLDYVSTAGLASRFLSFGLRLPNPSNITPSDPSDNTASLYQLTGQQFVAAGPTTSATLSLSPSAPQGWISFGPSGGATNVTSQISGLSPVPPMPGTVWLGAPVAGQLRPPLAPGEIEVTAMAPIIARPAALALTKTVGWTPATGGSKTLYPLPPTMDASAASMQLSSTPPEAANFPAAVAGIPALLIRLSLTEVKNQTGAGAGSAATDDVPYVYQLNATDEATRDLIYSAITHGSFGEASVTLLYTGGSPVGLLSDDLSDAALLAKNNLSVENQAPAVSAVQAQRLKALGPSPVSATLKDPINFLKLVWEVSVVNAPGFLLCYQTKTRAGLPPSIFEQAFEGAPVTGSGGRTAEFDILVQFKLSGTTTIPLQPFVNCIVVSATGNPPATLYAELSDQTGTPLQAYAPAFPPGNIGFELLRQPTVTPSSAPLPVDDLYHLVQYSIAPSTDFNSSIWSLAVGPTDNGTDLWSYQRLIPITRFLKVPANPTPYSVIGKTAALSFRLVDVYGDALPNVQSAQFTCFYNDPLISPAAWAGTNASYQFSAASSPARRPRTAARGAALTITLDFDVARVQPPPSTVRSGDTATYWQTVRNRFELILAQLQDANTTISANTSLAPSGPLGGPDDVRQALTGFINDVLGTLPARVPTRRKAQPTTAAATINLVVPFAEISKLADDINPLIVSLTLSRPPHLVNPPGAQHAPSDQLPNLLSASYAIPPRVSQGASTNQGAISLFAKNFEDAFANFDGKATALKVAQSASIAGQSDQDAAVAPFWAIRYSATGSNPSAINVSLQGPDKINYFAARPLYLQPFSGKAPSQKYYSKIDLDVWAEQFLRAYDDFVSPQMAVAISILDARRGTSFYSDLMACKSDLASTIANGVERLFVGPPVPTPDLGLSEAVASFRQALLVQLASAFTISTIVQIPATVQTATSRVPQLFGRLGAPSQTPSPARSPKKAAPPPPQSPYSLSNASVDLAPGTKYLTSLFTVTHPTADPYITLPLQYQAGFLQRDLDESEAIDGYVPSSWLRFVRPLDPIVCGAASIPVPLPFLPPVPSLVLQTASAHNATPGGTIGDEIRNALEWDYTVVLNAGQLAGQDDLHFTVAYNSVPEARLASATPVETLFDALATFQESNPIAPSDIQAVLSEAYGGGAATPGPSPAQLVVKSFLDRAQAINQAWMALWTQRAAMLAASDLKDEFYLDYQTDLSGAKLTFRLYGRAVASGATVKPPSQWPSSIRFGVGSTPWTIKNPTLGNNEYYAVDSFSIALGSSSVEQCLASITIAWTKLGILGPPPLQSAAFEAWVIRNANLFPQPSKAVVNADFIYQSQHAAFSTPAVPIIERNALAPIVPGKKKLRAILQQIIAPFSNTGLSHLPVINLECSYNYELVANARGVGPFVSWPVLALSAIEVPNDITTMVDQIATQIEAWHTFTTPPAGKAATLDFALTLFSTVGDTEMPLVEIHDIPIDVSAVPASWW